MATLGVFALINFNGTDLTAAFLGVYMVIFAVILAAYEFIWWQPVASLNKTFRKNFGFMYGLKGKGAYLIFIAFLSLGLKDTNVCLSGLMWASFVAWLAAGCFHIFFGFTWPQANDAYKPPVAGLSAQDDTVI